MPTTQHRPQGRLEDDVPVVVGGDCLAAEDDVEIGQSLETHRTPHQDLGGMFDRLLGRPEG